MIYFIYGIDAYSVKKAADKLAADFVASEGSDFNLIKLDGQTMKAGQFFDSVSTLPFLGAKRLVTVNGLLALGDKESKRVVAEKIKNIPDYSDVLFVDEGEPDKRESIFKVLSEKAKVERFDAPTPYLVTDFVKKKITEAGLKVTSQVANQISLAVGTDLSRAESETEKIISYTFYLDRDEVSADVVSNLIEPVSNVKIFDLTDAIADRRLGQAFSILSKMRKSGQDEAMIFNMIIFQLRNMLIIESLGSNASQSGLHPFVVKKTLSSIRKFKPGEIKKFYSDLAELDWKIKSGILEFSTAVDLLVANFCKS
ncbi:MAG: DNA polymerase III subunit delta [Patescibacteria group bacterium]|jgi:DNA polymerase-3 subunit delta